MTNNYDNNYGDDDDNNDDDEDDNRAHVAWKRGGDTSWILH